MRRVLLVPQGESFEEASEAPCVQMDEAVWEDGYSSVMDELGTGPLQVFWKHYYGASAEMVFSGGQLMELRKGIMRVTPSCVDRPALLQFLMSLSKMCTLAQRQKASLQVIAD